MKYTYKDEKVFCEKCGAENKKGASLCCNCRARINDLPVDSEVSENTTNDTIIKCTKCGEENRQGASFCFNCGAQINDLPADSEVSENATEYSIFKCKKCGEENKESALFCCNCGASINDLPADSEVSEKISKKSLFKCKKCGEENKDSALFCCNCGAQTNDTPVDLKVSEKAIWNSTFKCKKCGSEEWKLASLIYSSEASYIDITTQGESKVRRGLGNEITQTNSESTGSVKSRLADLCAPPLIVNHPGVFVSSDDFHGKYKVMNWFFSLILLASMLDSRTTWSQIFLIAIIFLLGHGYFLVKRSPEAYK